MEQREQPRACNYPTVAPAQTPAFDGAIDVLAALDARCALTPDRPAYIRLGRGGAPLDGLSYLQLRRVAQGVARQLIQIGETGDRVVLSCASELAFVAGLFGCFLAGRIAVPAPHTSGGRQAQRVAHVVADSGARAILCDERADVLDRLPTPASPGLAVVRVGTDWSAVPAQPVSRRWHRADDLALLQYTSGSVGPPRGVRITYRNISHNSAQIGDAYRLTGDSRILNWLPLFHDMGLIGILQGVFTGATCFLMSPSQFYRDPIDWLRAIGRHGITTSGGPDFAFRHCLRRAGEPGSTRGLDLESWQVAFVGAEPVRSRTLVEFSQRFAAIGFRAAALRPSYGLAESTLLVACSPSAVPPRSCCFDARKLHEDRFAQPVAEGSAGALDLVACGLPRGDQRLVVVDPETGRRCAGHEVGEIWLAGPSVADGYWGARDDERFHARMEGDRDAFLRTGDLGFLAAGELFVLGRIKNLLIRNGAKHSAEELESCAQRSHDALRWARCAAFATDDGARERVVLLQEVELRAAEPGVLIEAIRDAVSGDFLFEPDEIVLVRRGSLPVTTSGKIRHAQCRELFLAGTLRGELFHWHADAKSGGEPAEDPDARTAELVRIVAELTRASVVDPSVPLRDLGVGSLVSLDLQDRIEQRLGVLLPLRTLVGSATVRDLVASLPAAAPVIGAAGQDGAAAAAATAVRLPSESQKALWMAQQQSPKSGLYNVAVALRVAPPLHAEHLRQALHQMARRHPVLRAAYLPDAVNGVVLKADGALPGFTTVQAGEWSESRLRAAAVEQVRLPFDLATGPVCRMTHYRDGAGDDVLACSAHHIAVDLRSVEILLSELFTAYASRVRGGAAEPAAAAADYFGYIRWEQDYLLTAQAREAERIARDRLAGVAGPIHPGSRLLRASSPDHAGSAVEFSVGPRATSAVEGLAAATATTTFAVVCAALAVLVYRYTNRADFMLGTIASTRPGAAYAGAIGCFTNVLQLRARIDPGSSYRTLVALVHAARSDALDCRHLPHALLGRPGPDGRKGAMLPQVMCVDETPQVLAGAGLAAIVLGEETAEPMTLAGLQLRAFALPRRSAEFDLILRYLKDGAALRGSFDFRLQAMDRDLAAEWARELTAVLDELTADPDAPVARGSERYGLPYPAPDAALAGAGAAGRLFPIAMRAVWQAHTDHPAVIWPGGVVTHSELRTRATRLARELSARGAAPGSRIGLCLHQSLDYIVAVAAVTLIGGVFVPLDPSAPPERLQAMLAKSRPSVIVHATGTALPHPTGAVLFDVNSGADGREDADDPQVLPGRSDLAYVMWTSGSTGVPKGVAVTHASLAHHVEAFNEEFAIGPEDRVLAFSTSTFDAVIEEMVPALATGASIVLPDPSEREAYTAFTRRLEKDRVTVVNLPTPFWEGWVEHLGAVGERIPPSLRLCIIGNMQVSSEAAQAWQLLPHADRLRLVNAYGPTEATVSASFHTMAAATDRDEPVPIGRPLRGTRFHVLDEQMLPLPPGALGELYIGGPRVAAGYVDDPQATAAAFVPDRFDSDPAARLYRTGDLVRCHPRGHYTFVGRIDDQVKIRGYRVELGEIEAACRLHPAIEHVAVVLEGRLPGHEELVAYVGARPGNIVHQAAVQSFLERFLPSHMIPNSFVCLDTLPRTSSGKIDRQALIARGLVGPVAAAVSEPPRNDMERALASIWAAVLHVDRVGVHDNFFALGGHSLSATRVLSRITAALEVEVPLSMIFENPTISSQAAWIEMELARTEGVALDADMPGAA